MMPFGNVLLGAGLGILALVLGGIKLVSPASPKHRQGARIAALASFALLWTMAERILKYQIALSWWSRIHVLLGIATFIVFIAKFCASRKIYFTPRLLRPLGFALTALFPLAAFGLALPFISHASSWNHLKPTEITQNPVQESFNLCCTSCHTREKAVEGLGIRIIPDWINITEPMAWAGTLPRESTRGALAAILAVSQSSEIGSLPSSLNVASLDPIDKHCINCHDKQRTLRTRKTPELWRTTIIRMQGYAQKMPNSPKIDEKALEEVLEFLRQKQP
ncbi:MAG: hypothetical protein HQM08_13560 [Candidatus Riflebacteria bacterium]|nr:hypothetical protein [Candidatus Riflebacteria bacterium]